MAATGNEAVKLSQLKELYKVASDTSYGVVRLVSDEDLMSLVGGSSAEVGSFELEPSSNIVTSNSSVSGTLAENGAVVITGSFNTRSQLDRGQVLFTIPEGYRPKSTANGTLKISGQPANTQIIEVGTDGIIYAPSTIYMYYTYQIAALQYMIDAPVPPAEIPDGAVITVQQLKMLMDSGSSSGPVETVIFDNIFVNATDYFDARPYDSLSITVERTNDGSHSIETISAPYSSAKYSSPSETVMVGEIADASRLYITARNYNFRIIKVVGVKNG